MPVIPRDKIIVALDCSEQRALDLAQQLKGRASWLKVGMTLYYAAGPRIVQTLKEQGFKVFVDLKLHDIPHQARGAAQSVVAAGADMLTVHGSGGLPMLQAAQEGADEAFAQFAPTHESSAASVGEPLREKPITLAVTVLTSLDEATLQQVGVTRTLEQQVAALAQLAQKAGLTGVVASPREAETLRTLLGSKAAIVCPGVRPSGSAQGDQSRVSAPQEALRAGASYLVIGRPITDAPDPAAALEAIVAELS
ncbi:MAG: orotidine-5'-phosphate decarboxylase [Coriobacteriales bacterium]|jgi:orotidine-5'-phosphate decarboxylase|nr:orotidine-5'-phosphate decarboxylase [Coriobacteriales bacterium]